MTNQHLDQTDNEPILEPPMNDDRAERAQQALDQAGYMDENDLDSAMGDLLADLRHLCAREEVSFDSIMLMSEIHYNEECDQEDEEAR